MVAMVMMVMMVVVTHGTRVGGHGEHRQHGGERQELGEGHGSFLSSGMGGDASRNDCTGRHHAPKPDEDAPGGDILSRWSHPGR